MIKNVPNEKKTWTKIASKLANNALARSRSSSKIKMAIPIAIWKEIGDPDRDCGFKITDLFTYN